MQRGQTDIFQAMKGHDAFVIDHGTIGTKGYLLRLITLIGSTVLAMARIAN